MKGNTFKTIGILGGMGPEAGADLFVRIVRNFQKNGGAQLDSDFPRILLNSINPVMPWESPHENGPYCR